MGEFSTDTEMLTAANGILDKLISGHLQMSDFTCQLAVSIGTAQEVFYYHLAECEENLGISPSEFVKDVVGIECSDLRLQKILDRQEQVSTDELWNWLDDLDSYAANYIKFYGFIPIDIKSDVQPYVIIVKDGVPLEPEFSIVGVFNSKADAETYFENNYDY